jgi:folate-binding protein YgfZ
LKQRDLFFDFSARTKLRVTGNDRLRFLNGQATADVGKATVSRAVEACFLDAKGKMNAHGFLYAASDCIFLDADAALKETLQRRLERYIIADDVSIEDASKRLSILHVLTETAPALPTAKWTVSTRRFAGSGWDLWIDTADHEETSRKLACAFSFCDFECAEVLRIEQGIPRWSRELTNEIIPIEANLEERAIDYEKGCYIGQEVVSRMKMSGQRNKRLCGLISTADLPLSPGLNLVAAPGEEKNAGWITSAARSERLGKEIALGYVRRGFDSAGKRLWATNAEDPSRVAEVVIVDLPFKQ